jgi:hypothetical protein
MRFAVSMRTAPKWLNGVQIRLQLPFECCPLTPSTNCISQDRSTRRATPASQMN